MRKIYITIVAAGLISMNSVTAQNKFSENFDDVATMIASGGWVEHNNSVPLGVQVWQNGINLAIPAYNGAADSYAESGFMATDDVGVGNISHWLITPTISLSNGDVVSFFTSSYNNLNYPDRMELRLNTLNTTNAGTNDTSVADFNQLLLSVNPTLQFDTTFYPQDYWGQFSVTISGLSGTTDCRIAFRYFVTNGGGGGANSSTVGIDAFSVDMPVGVHEIQNGLDVSIYPNPSSDRIAIDFGKALNENGNVKIYNSLGQTVIAFNVSKGQTKALFNVSDLSPGSYSVVLSSPETITKKNFVRN